MALTTDFKIPKLNGANYRDWTFNMRLYLESLELFGHVDGSIGVPDEEASEQVKQEYKTASKKAWTYICFAIEPDQQIHVRNVTRVSSELHEEGFQSFICVFKPTMSYFSENNAVLTYLLLQSALPHVHTRGAWD